MRRRRLSDLGPQRHRAEHVGDVAALAPEALEQILCLWPDLIRSAWSNARHAVSLPQFTCRGSPWRRLLSRYYTASHGTAGTPSGADHAQWVRARRAGEGARNR